MGGDNAQLPLLVMVSGAPGSGKTTLAKLLAKELDVPWLNRDTFSRGIRRTEGAMPASSRSWSVWYGTLASLLRQSVSLVMDQTMYRGIAERCMSTFLRRFLH
jgi:predicted kinase